jgi:sugar-specific transcriptional regulator TrmB
MSGKDHHRVINTSQYMHEPLFQELGLSPNEAKIYESLLTYGPSGVSTVSLRAGVHRRNAYDALQRLLEKGLVSEFYGKNETVFQPVDPGKLMELIREKEMRLAAVMPGLLSTYRENKAPEQASIYKGPEGIKNYLRDVLDEGEDMYVLGAEGAWLDERIATYTEWFLREAKSKGIKIHAIFDHDAQSLTIPLMKLAHRYKFLPETYDTNTTMDIFGNYVVTYTGTSPGKLLDSTTIFVLQSPDLANSYRTWWKLLWDLLPEEKPRKRKTRG